MSDPAKSADPLSSEADALHEQAVRKLQDDVRLADGLEKLARPTHSGPKGPQASPAKLSDPLLYRVNAPATSAAPSAPEPAPVAPSTSEPVPSEPAPSEPAASELDDGATLHDATPPAFDPSLITKQPTDPRLLQDLEATYRAPRHDRLGRHRNLVIGVGLASGAVVVSLLAWFLMREAPRPVAPPPPTTTAPPVVAVTAIAPRTTPEPSVTSTAEPTTAPTVAPTTTATVPVPPRTTRPAEPSTTARPPSTATAPTSTGTAFSPWKLPKP